MTLAASRPRRASLRGLAPSGDGRSTSAEGNDPTESLATAQRELEKAFQLFESGRTKLMKSSEPTKAQP
jgi:hypothetical protein